MDNNIRENKKPKLMRREEKKMRGNVKLGQESDVERKYNKSNDTKLKQRN
jgi:hypothetical protein